MTHPAHAQAAHAVRFEWGRAGAEALAAPVTVVVDVLSFTTTVSVAVERGIEVLPFGWRDERAAAYATARGATLAVGRREARPGEASLSPASVREAPLERLVLPSPNGSTICSHLVGRGTDVYAACLRDASAVAAVVAARARETGAVAVVAAGERWPDGSLRPAVEDLWGAGAVLAALARDGVTGFSPEARVAEAAYRSVADDLPVLLPDCASGRELVDAGFADDVAIAAEVDASGRAPVLRDGAFVAAG